jgi:hypothetical protein
MKISFLALVLMTNLCLATAVLAQGTVSDGPTAKGNSVLKPGHTVNDGAPARGANSFTQSEAQAHITHAGFSSVSGLVKGADGVWRGTAVRGGTRSEVALDFKGNVTTGASVAGGPSVTIAAEPRGASLATSPAAVVGADGTSAISRRGAAHRRHHHARHHIGCTPGPNGAACSGADRNRNGISDKEDRALRAGAKP